MTQKSISTNRHIPLNSWEDFSSSTQQKPKLDSQHTWYKHIWASFSLSQNKYPHLNGKFKIISGLTIRLKHQYLLAQNFSKYFNIRINSLSLGGESSGWYIDIYAPMFKPSREQQRAYIRGIRNRIRFILSMLVLALLGRICGLNSELRSGFPGEGAATSGNSNKGVGFQSIVQSKLRDAQSEPC